MPIYRTPYGLCNYHILATLDNCSLATDAHVCLLCTLLPVLRFLVAVVTYVVVGVLVMKYRKGAQGVELIPNYHFWKDFPFLVKVGCLSV